MTAKMTDEQKKAFDIMRSGQNIFLTGNAGTGKSFLLKHFIDYAEEEGLKVLVTAPTGIAAINVGGSTVHRTFKVPLEPMSPGARTKTPSAVKEADIIIIDEISMVRADVFQYVARVIAKAEEKAEKHIQLIVIGDFFQLPPVVTKADRQALMSLWGYDLQEGFAFEAPMWKNFRFQNIVLKETIRQSDPVFIGTLNGLRRGDFKNTATLKQITAEKWQASAIYLCGTNREANDFNNRKLEEINAPEFTFESKIQGKVGAGDKPVEDTIRLKVGARVMVVINDILGNYQNGSMGYVEEIDADKTKITVKLDNGKTAVIGPHVWEIVEYDVSSGGLQKNIIGTFEQLPLKLGYAITIHKSQGQTFESVNINPSCFCEGQLYVGLSRCTSAGNLYLNSPYINQRWLKTSRKVIAFYNSL